MKNLDIYNLYQSLSNLSYKEDIILPVKIGYICVKNRNLIEPYYKAIEELRTNIIKKYIKEDENGEYRVPEDKIDEANKELQDILNMEEQEDIKIQKININDIQESLPMDIITGLMPILIEEEE